jgi:cadmium resistance protein CadD (predicted permease)
MARSIVLAVVAFVSTNIDDLVVLVALFADQRISRASIVLGQLSGLGALTGASLACAMLALAVPTEYLRYLGLLPMLVGALHLARRAGSQSVDDEPEQSLAGSGAAFQVALVTIANGSDNIAVYVPLFARQAAGAIVTTCIVFAAMACAWCAMAAGLMSRPRLRALIGRRGHQLLPFVLIGIGLLIVSGH